MITILIADDHKLIRETWSFILNSDPRFKVIATCSTADEVLHLARQLHPDVILMDINMGAHSGMEATARIKEVWPGARIIGVTMHSQPAFARKMLQVGASGYVTKNSSKEEMMKAILEVHKGNKYICEEIKDIISDQNTGATESESVNSLTEREMEIINLIKNGQSSREISQSLNISLKTVEVHRHNILKKLKLKNSASLVNFMNTRSAFI